MSARWRPTDLDAINALASPPCFLGVTEQNDCRRRRNSEHERRWIGGQVHFALELLVSGFARPFPPQFSSAHPIYYTPFT